MAQILNTKARDSLTKWLTINDDDKFTERIFFTVREMFTVVKNKIADKPTSQDHHDQHASHQELAIMLPRFDKVIRGVEDNRRKQNNSQNKVPSYNRRTRGYFNEPDFKIGSRHRVFTPEKLGYNSIVDGPAEVDTRAVKM